MHLPPTHCPPGTTPGPRQAIVRFVERVTTQGSPDFVPAAERIAVFDNDGTLWAEQPIYFQLHFVVDRVKALAPQHPEWKTKEPFALAARGRRARPSWPAARRGSLELMAATHSGMTTEEFAAHGRRMDRYREASEDRAAVTRDGLPADARTARLPARQRLQDLHRLRRRHRIHAALDRAGVWHSAGAGRRKPAAGFNFELRDGKPVLVKLPKIVLIDDKAGKPVGIQRFIGRRPIAAFGNSDGDLQMLQWTGRADGARLRVYRPPHGRRARVGLRPRIAHRQARQGPRRGEGAGLDGRRHEKRLETNLPLNEGLRR